MATLYKQPFRDEIAGINMGNTRMNDIAMDVLNGAQSGDLQAILIAGLSVALLCIYYDAGIALIAAKPILQNGLMQHQNPDRNRSGYGYPCQHGSS